MLEGTRTRLPEEQPPSEPPEGFFCSPPWTPTRGLMFFPIWRKSGIEGTALSVFRAGVKVRRIMAETAYHMAVSEE